MLFEYVSNEELETIIQIVRRFYKIKHPYSTGKSLQVWQELYNELAQALHMPAPKLFIDSTPSIIGAYGYTRPRPNGSSEIHLNKYSLITALHEFYHAVINARRGLQSEHETYAFSYFVFRLAVGEPHGTVAPDPFRARNRRIYAALEQRLEVARHEKAFRIQH